jgi:hypothetical protein
MMMLAVVGEFARRRVLLTTVRISRVIIERVRCGSHESPSNAAIRNRAQKQATKK